MLYAASLVFAVNLGVSILAFYGLIGFSGQGADLGLLTDGYFWQVLTFTVKQAALSALCSFLFAWPLARGLYFLPNPFAAKLFLNLCLLAFVLPSLILITGLVILFGGSGWLTPYLPDNWNLYGLQGILLAHIYMNMPFAIRVIRQQYNGIPDTSWRLAQQLKFSAWQRFKLLEWPVIKPVVMLLTGFIFILCFNSFTVVLALGGGPRATTLEVAIYQALKYDFNIPEALTFAWVQLFCAGLLFFIIYRTGVIQWLTIETPQRKWRPRPTPPAALLYKIGYGFCWLFLLLPMVALMPKTVHTLIQGFDFMPLIRPVIVTVSLGLSVSVLALIVAYLLLIPIRLAKRKQARHLQVVLDWLSTHALIAPAMVTSVGLYILFLPLIDIDIWGMVFVLLLNTLMVIPFIIQQLRPRLLQYDLQYAAIVENLKFSWRTRVAVEWPYLQQTLRYGLALALLLAIGDVAVFAIFGSPQWNTLPWMIYSYAASYRIGEAAAASFLLLLLCGLSVRILKDQ